jgi:hypothetical protein
MSGITIITTRRVLFPSPEDERRGLLASLSFLRCHADFGNLELVDVFSSLSWYMTCGKCLTKPKSFRESATSWPCGLFSVTILHSRTTAVVFMKRDFHSLNSKGLVTSSYAFGVVAAY